MIHENSRKAHRAFMESGKLGQRYTEVAKGMLQLERATDDELREHLGYKDMNCVRPRITELLGKTLKNRMKAPTILRECGNKRNPRTKKLNRIVEIIPELKTKVEIAASFTKIIVYPKPAPFLENSEQLTFGF